MNPVPTDPFEYFNWFVESFAMAGYQVRRNRRGDVHVQCPGHDDRGPSLHLSLKDGKIVAVCFGACQSEIEQDRGAWIERMLAKVYLTPAQLFVPEPGGPQPTRARTESAMNEPNPKKPPVTWRKGGELDPTPIEFLVEGMVPLGMMGAIGGRDGRGKTLFGLEIAKCVLTGEKLFGQFAVPQGKVFLMLLDDPEQLVRQRLDELGITDHPNLRVATQNDVDLKDKPGMLEYLRRTLPAEDPTFTMIDALYLFYPKGGGADQANSGSAMGPVMETLDQLATALRGTLAVVAHDNKAGSDLAGSQVIRNAFKWIVRLTLPQEFEDDPEGGVLTQERVLQLNKLKMGRTTSWHLKVGAPGQWVFDGDSTAYRTARLEDRIEAQVFNHGAHTVEEFRAALRAKKPEVTTAVLKLHLAGKITRAERPTASGKGRPAIVYDHPIPKA